MNEGDIHRQKHSITRRGAMAVVFSNAGDKVLLLRREIFILWDLPGGGIERDEDPAEAAVRECREETGYHVEVDRPVGVYRHQSVYGRGDQLTYVFRAHAVGGRPIHLGLEITGLRWSPLAHLPVGLQPLQRQMVMDAMPVLCPPVERWLKFPIWQLYPARAAFTVVRLINGIIRLFIKNPPR